MCAYMYICIYIIYVCIYVYILYICVYIYICGTNSRNSKSYLLLVDIGMFNLN